MGRQRGFSQSVCVILKATTRFIVTNNYHDKYSQPDMKVNISQSTQSFFSVSLREIFNFGYMREKNGSVYCK
jgi:hypothetical protein